MIGLRVLGLLGNHIFQYAFIYSVSKKLNTPFYIEYGKARMNKPRMYTYFHLKKNHPLKNYLYSKIYKFKDEINIDASTPPESELSKIKDNVMYIGFVQSEKYFNWADVDIHEILQLKKKHINEFDRKYKSFFDQNKVVVMHVRRGDYAEAGGDYLGGLDIRLPASYFHNALKQIEKLESYKLVIISNDLEFCQEHFGGYSNCMFESNSEIIDMQLMMNADVVITSNSSFSWWGAYLNRKRDKKVIAPKYWLGFQVQKEFPTGIMSVKNWNWIAV